MTTPIELNPDDRQYTSHTWLIAFHLAPAYIVHADNVSDAYDLIIDEWERTESENPGYFLTPEEEDEEEYPDEFISGGNHSRMTSFKWHETYARLEAGWSPGAIDGE